MKKELLAHPPRVAAVGKRGWTRCSRDISNVAQLAEGRAVFAAALQV